MGGVRFEGRPACHRGVGSDRSPDTVTTVDDEVRREALRSAEARGTEVDSDSLVRKQIPGNRAGHSLERPRNPERDVPPDQNLLRAKGVNIVKSTFGLYVILGRTTGVSNLCTVAKVSMHVPPVGTRVPVQSDTTIWD